MEKIVRNSDILEDHYYFCRHKSGLGIFLYPMKGYSSAYALFGTHYGSVDTTFKTSKESEFATVPEGIAHFLEHKLFESEDGDAFELFAKTGASANAFTSFEKTCYLFSTTDHFEESLKSLITFVQDPYFTDKTVEKEQGIIGQEIRMYEDDPGWRVFFNLLCALYHNNPVRIDIAGTIDSISHIDKDLLYRCYHTFYNLSNMVVAVAGNFDVDAAIRIIEENLKDCEKVEVETQVPDEPETVVKAEHIQKLSVALPLFNIGYKLIPAAPENELSQQIRCSLVLDAIAGKGSELYRRLYEERLIDDDFGTELFSGKGYCAAIFAGESRDPKRVMDEIRAEFSNFRDTGIMAEDFERVRRSMYGSTIQMFNDVDMVANELVNSYFSNRDIYAPLKEIANVTLEEVNTLLKEAFQDDKMAISIIESAE